MEKPLQLVYNVDGKLELNPEALQVLESIEDPMIVVAVVGAAQTGKSYLMNCLAGNKKGFSVSSTVQSHTKGIWMWCRPLPQRPNEVLLLLDTEGLGDSEKGETDNNHSIYSLAILLSSIFIYNGKNQIDQKSLQDLHFVAELSKQIEMKSQSNSCHSWNVVRFFPEFVWVIRDLTLDLSIDGKDVTPDEYLEHSLELKTNEISEQDKKYNELRRCIRNLFPSRCCFAFPTPTHRKKLKQLQELKDKDMDEEFVTERQKLINYIHTHKKVKRVLGGQLITGRRFAELAKVYVGMMANGVLPCVESSVAKLMEVENQAAVDEALKFYDNEMKKFSESDNLTMSKLEEYYTKKKGEAFNIFHKRSMSNNSANHIKQLEEMTSYTYKSLMAKITEKSQDQCKAHLVKEMASVKENLTSGHYLRAAGFQELKNDLDKPIKDYEEKTKNETEGCAVLARFLEEEKPHLNHIQEMDSRLTEEQKHASDISRQDCLMSVTRDPDANKQIMEKPLQLVFKKDGKLQLNPEARKVLQSIEVPMVVVAVVGAARTGKSYLMNCLAGDKKGFSVDSTVQSHTKGIWMWCRPLPQRPNEVLLLLDTEGLGDPEKTVMVSTGGDSVCKASLGHVLAAGGIDRKDTVEGDTDNDNFIYSLAILLSSILIYNGKNQIDWQSLQDLHFVTELSKRIRVKSKPDACDSWDLIRFFPEFVWLIRDLTLDLEIEGKDVTPNEYLEHILKLKDSEISEQEKKCNKIRSCIRNHFCSRCCFAFPIPTHGKKFKELPELEDKDLDKDFVTERQKLINYIHTHKKVKRVGGQLVTGRRFAELANAYVEMMADGFIPCVESSLAKLEEVENQAAVDEAVKFYDDEMKKFSESGCLTISELLENHNAVTIKAFNIFHKRSMDNSSGKHIQQLEENMSSTYKSLMVKIKEKFEKECKEHANIVMSSIEINLKNGHYQKSGGIQQLKKDFYKATKEYEERTKNEMEGLAVLTHYLEKVNPCLDHVQEMDSELTTKRTHASALEQEVESLKQKMKMMEQERKESEERRNKEIIEQIRKRFEEGKTWNVEDLKEAMEHMRSEMEKYTAEGRMEDAQRARQMYEYLEKKYEEATKWSFKKILRGIGKFAALFPALSGFAKVIAFVVEK